MPKTPEMNVTKILVEDLTKYLEGKGFGVGLQGYDPDHSTLYCQDKQPGLPWPPQTVGRTWCPGRPIVGITIFSDGKIVDGNGMPWPKEYFPRKMKIITTYHDPDMFLTVEDYVREKSKYAWRCVYDVLGIRGTASRWCGECRGRIA